MDLLQHEAQNEITYAQSMYILLSINFPFFISWWSVDGNSFLHIGN